jgi:RNA polymerase sigma factor (sigma-70 family)
MSFETDFPAAEAGLGIYARLLARDPTAPDDLAAAYLDPLARYIVACNRGVDPHYAEEAAQEAILGVIKNPCSFDPHGNLDLAGYLRMAARGDLRNLLDRDAKHHQGRVRWESVELSGDERNSIGRDDDPSLPLQVDEAVRARASAVDPSVRDGLTEAENRVLDLILRGEKRTSVFAEALGITDLPPKDQRREVKRVKDKLKKRLGRTGWKHEPDT